MKSKFISSIVHMFATGKKLYVKKHFLCSLLGIIISSYTVTCYAQPGNLIVEAQKINKIAHDERDTSGYFMLPENVPETRLNDININAIRHFTLFFENHLHVKWYKVPGAFIVYFTCDGIKKMAAYNSSGILIHTLSYYNEHQLPGFVRRLIKSIYYDYIINQVVQIEEDNQLVYMVQMEDAASFITVAVDDYEMKIVKAIKKLNKR